MASVPPSLIEFTRDCLSKSVPRLEINKALVDAGWSDREATAAVESFAESTLPVPVPKKRVSSGPREAFLHLLAMLLLYMTAFATGAVLFLVIDVFLSDPTNRGIFGADRMARFHAAILMASLPVLALVRWAINRDIIRNPAIRIAPVVRTLSYITLLITSLIMVCDMVAVLLGFLNGDLTLTFILKSSVVVLLAGGIFLWYISGLHFEETLSEGKQQDAPVQESLWRPRLAVAGFFTASVCLVFSLWIAGNPVNQRLIRLDSQRVANLRSLQSAIERFYKKETRLPKNLEELKTFPDTYDYEITDAVTGAPYFFSSTTKTDYKLGAVFDLATPPRQPNSTRSRDGFYHHKAGSQRFDLTVK
ncbi:MAG: hypothetical protein HOD99_11080 [Planctomycetaceae bacterium]|nr:hypothetical protein [Planctomycetaceae bacterium]MBT4159370.1 hypothetical protein [Planctomycetaceae bacterium]MBT6642817.1 hypothetical protein [Planctomycetaceae bacterium]